ncbi:MAG TPA: hypothetical protein VNO31_38965 [Umezawaea sp.]|nr:hypothetical protein [Umezawaea sp.]
MALRRAALWVSALLLLGMNIIGASTATAAVGPATGGMTATIKTGSAPSESVGILSNCPTSAISHFPHPGGYICETTPLYVEWRSFPSGQLIGYDDIVIGTNFLIYHNTGSGWGQIGNGEASHTLPLPTIGLFAAGTRTIQVLGTDNMAWCTTTTNIGSWSAWRRC